MDLVNDKNIAKADFIIGMDILAKETNNKLIIETPNGTLVGNLFLFAESDSEKYSELTDAQKLFCKTTESISDRRREKFEISDDSDIHLIPKVIFLKDVVNFNGLNRDGLNHEFMVVMIDQIISITIGNLAKDSPS